MSEEDDPPPGGGINETVSKVSNIINNINQTATESCQRSFSVSDTSKERGRDSPGNVKNRSKQLKLNDYWLSKPAENAEFTNRFGILACDDNDAENCTDANMA